MAPSRWKGIPGQVAGSLRLRYVRGKPGDRFTKMAYACSHQWLGAACACLVAGFAPASHMANGLEPQGCLSWKTQPLKETPKPREESQAPHQLLELALKVGFLSFLKESLRTRIPTGLGDPLNQTLGKAPLLKISLSNIRLPLVSHRPQQDHAGLLT